MLSTTVSISCNVALGEPNELATNSRSFWLAARCPGLAGNGQYCGETVVLWCGNIPAARNRTRLLAIPGRLSQCLRRAVRFWLTAAPARCRLTSVGDFCVDLHNPGIDQSVWAPFARRAPRVAPFGSGLAGWPIRATGAPNRPPVQPLRTRAIFERNDKDNSRLPGRDHARCARVNTSLPERLQITLGSRSRLALAFDIRKTEAGKL